MQNSKSQCAAICKAWSHYTVFFFELYNRGGSVAEWLACWNQAEKGLGSNRSRDAVG